MRNFLIVGSVFALATGCASAPPLTEFGKEHPDADIAVRRPVVLAIPELRTIYGDAPKSVEDLLDADAATVRTAIKHKLAELDIPLTIEDPKYSALGNGNFEKIYRIGKRPMSEFVDCGTVGMGQRSATHRMYMSLVTIVDSLRPTSTRVRSTFTVQARDMSAGMNRPSVPCSSTGRLERLLIESVATASDR